MTRKKQALTTGEVATYCEVGVVTVHRWIKAGHLKAYKLPGQGNNRIKVPEFLAFLRAHDMTIPKEFLTDSRRVLIVDDDASTVKAMRRVLKKADFETESALDGFSAGALLGTFSPAVMTLDLMMPGMSGFDVIRHVRASPHYAHTKILVVSGLPQAELDKARATGADDVLPKPFKNQALVDKVMQIIDVGVTR